MNNVKRKSNFVTVDNSFIRNPEISFKAKGLYIYMASMYEGWNFTIKSISSQSKEGVNSIESSIKELKEFGHIIYEKHSNGSGTYHLIDNPAKTGKPSSGKAKSGKSTRIKKNNTLEEKFIREEEEDLLSFISTLRDKYIGINFPVGKGRYYISTDGFIKMVHNDKKVSGGKAKDIYKKIFDNWNDIKEYFESKRTILN